jgi:hypothetical protein
MSNAWDRPLESGLRDDFDATIVRSTFGTDARYQAGAVVLLKWDLAGVAEDGPFEDTVLITLGSNWTTLDGGATITHESGKDRYFGAQSHYGKIIERCKEIGVGEALGARGNPFQAKVWEGLNFHFIRESINYGGEIGSREKVMPTVFNGEGAAAPVAAPVAPVASNVTNIAAAPAAASTNGAVIRAKLTAAAKQAADFSSFLDAAMEIPGVAEDDAIVAEVIDEAAFYASARG